MEIFSIEKKVDLGMSVIGKALGFGAPKIDPPVIPPPPQLADVSKIMGLMPTNRGYKSTLLTGGQGARGPANRGTNTLLGN